MLNFRGMLHPMRQNNKNISEHTSTHVLGKKDSKNKLSVMPILRVFALSGILASCVHAAGKADDYIRTSLSSLFDNPNKFECQGGERSAICVTDKYELSAIDGFTLRHYRYTLDYKDNRVIERISGALEAPSTSEIKVFLPKKFECANFTQIHNDKEQVHEQLVCTITSDSYRVWLRLRAKVHTPAFANADAMSLLQIGTTFLERSAQDLKEARTDEERERKLGDLQATFSQIDVNLYGIEIALTKPELPQKIYEHLFAGMLDYVDDAQEHTAKKYNQLAHTLYNSGVGYIYGNAMGYALGNDVLDLRTKESLVKLFMVMRDSAMLDSDVRTVSIALTNRTNKGFNLGNAFAKLTKQKDLMDVDKGKVAHLLNLINGDMLNRYRIESSASRIKNHHK